MGTVTSSTVIYNNGTLASTPYQLETCTTYEDAAVSLEYAYGPALLPCPSDPRRGLWRYSNLLPLAEGPVSYPLPVGDTPLMAPHQLRTMMGLPHLWIKDETKAPTGSNKDRATALVLEYALRNRISAVTCASTGNVAVSLAVGAAAAGVKAFIFVASTVSDAKLNIMLLAGATVIKVAGGYEAAFALSRQAARRLGWYERNTGVNPLTLEGKKTVAFEIWEQLGYRSPDVVIVPTGDGVTLSGIVKGFRELRACGAVSSIPRVIGVQAETCQPLKRAWENNALTIAPSAQVSATIADGIAVDRPIGSALALRDVRESEGAFVAVSDNEMLHAIQLLARTTGILAEPAAAAALAGLTAARGSGLVHAREEIVLLVTGSGLKRPEYLVTERTPLNVDEQEEPLDDIVASLAELV